MSTYTKTIKLCLLAALRCTKCSKSLRSLAVIITQGLCLSLLAVSFIPHQAAAADNAAQLSNPSRSLSAHEVAATLLTTETQPVVAPHPKRANFEGEDKSRDAQRVADWVVDSGDNRGMPFVIVDKIDAKVFVFDTDGRLRGATPGLLGLGQGDDSIPGIGNRKLSGIRPEERTTPAGRFVASLGYNFHGKDVLWVDYNIAISLHRIVTTNPRSAVCSAWPLRRHLTTVFPMVASMFRQSSIENVVSPTFTGTHGIVYILPEIRSKSEIFASYYDVRVTPYILQRF